MHKRRNISHSVYFLVHVCRRLHLHAKGIGLNEQHNIDKDNSASYKALSVTSSIRKDEVSRVSRVGILHSRSYTYRKIKPLLAGEFRSIRTYWVFYERFKLLALGECLCKPFTMPMLACRTCSHVGQETALERPVIYIVYLRPGDPPAFFPEDGSENGLHV